MNPRNTLALHNRSTPSPLLPACTCVSTTLITHGRVMLCRALAYGKAGQHENALADMQAFLDIKVRDIHLDYGEGNIRA